MELHPPTCLFSSWISGDVTTYPDLSTGLKHCPSCVNRLKSRKERVSLSCTHKTFKFAEAVNCVVPREIHVYRNAHRKLTIDKHGPFKYYFSFSIISSDFVCISDNRSVQPP